MALVSGGRSTLNPNAPLFIPAALRQVEDFSPEWWNLVNTATWFRNYWLSQQKDEDLIVEDNTKDVVQMLPDSIDLGVDEEILNMEAQFEEFLQSSKVYESYGIKSSNGITENSHGKFLVKNQSMPKERALLFQREPARNWEKPAKIVGPKYSPRFIQQPR